MTPAESAEKEAEEEAGVLGIVVADPVSVYRYDKRGVWPAEVVLYPMRVLRELDEDEWEEALRTLHQRSSGGVAQPPPPPAVQVQQAALRRSSGREEHVGSPAKRE